MCVYPLVEGDDEDPLETSHLGNMTYMLVSCICDMLYEYWCLSVTHFLTMHVEAREGMHMEGWD